MHLYDLVHICTCTQVFAESVHGDIRRTYKTTLCRKRPRRKDEAPTIGTTELRSATPTAIVDVKQCSLDEGPVVAIIRTWREGLGVSVEPLRSEVEEQGFSKPIIGIKDLRQLSRMHSSAPVGLKPDDFTFIYCIRKDQRDSRARYNPYDLREVGAKEAQEEAVYYTVSAHCVTQVGW